MQISNALTDPPIKSRSSAKGDDVELGGAGDAAAGSESAKTAEGQGHVDVDWIESVRESERKEMSRLDTELKGYSSNLIKESMRVSVLAVLLQSCG
jgi:COP9 signalosome complex subunit 1